MTHRILVTDKVSKAGLTPVADETQFEIVSVDDSSTAEFVEALADADALIVRSATKVTPEMLAQAGNLKAIGRAGVGVDNVNIPAATERGVAVFNAPGGNTIAAAELTVGLMLATARNIPAANASLLAGRWDRATFRGVELRGKTLGLVGAGRIGTEVGIRCLAFGMSVLVHDPYLTQVRLSEIQSPVTTLDNVLEGADFISIHVPLSDETRGLIGVDAFAKMKDTAFLINASRGGVVDESALAEALSSGDIAGAALDVYEAEPLGEDSPLRSAPNLVLTPHLGASTHEAQLGVATEVAEKIKALLTNGDSSSALNAADLS